MYFFWGYLASNLEKKIASKTPSDRYNSQSKSRSKEKTTSKNLRKPEKKNIEELEKPIKFEAEILPEWDGNNRKDNIINDVKNRIIKRSSKPKSVVRNYGISDDNDPNAIKQVY